MMQTKPHSIWDKALNLILPPRCVLSGETVEAQGMIAPSVWNTLDFIAEPMCVRCGVPFEFAVEPDDYGAENKKNENSDKTADSKHWKSDTNAGVQCASCVSNPPPFISARSALIYRDAGRELILSFKHADKTHLVEAFSPWMMRSGADMIQDADAIIPVPLHYWRLVSRRYNQAVLMGWVLSRDSGLPCYDMALKRTRATPSQGFLNAKERAKNVKRAFAVNAKYQERLKGKTVILLDDVYTTGATVKECAKALLSADVKAVHVLALARVMRGV